MATKNQIRKIEILLLKAYKAQYAAENTLAQLCAEIVDVFGVTGNVDYLAGDGFGFTPESNNDTHVIVEALIENAKQGVDITEDWMLNNLTI